MTGAKELTVSMIVAAAEGSDEARAKILETVASQVRLMVLARLAPSPAQLGAVDEIAQQALVALNAGLARLKTRTAAGLKAYLSGVVQHKVADFIRAGGRTRGAGPVVCSLDTTVADFSQVGPMWQFLSASGVSPRTAVDQAERIRKLMEEFGGLRPLYREVLTLTFFDQLTTVEVAERLHLSRSRVSRLWGRARKTLQRRMSDGIVRGGDGDRAG